MLPRIAQGSARTRAARPPWVTQPSRVQGPLRLAALTVLRERRDDFTQHRVFNTEQSHRISGAAVPLLGRGSQHPLSTHHWLPCPMRRHFWNRTLLKAHAPLLPAVLTLRPPAPRKVALPSPGGVRGKLLRTVATIFQDIHIFTHESVHF